MQWRRATRDETIVGWVWAAGAVAALAARGLAPLAASRLPACALHSITGIPCPTCGATRSAMALAQGEWGAAIAFNPLATLALGGFAAGAVLVPAWFALGAPLATQPLVSPRAFRWTAAAALLANWLFLVARGI